MYFEHWLSWNSVFVGIYCLWDHRDVWRLHCLMERVCFAESEFSQGIMRVGDHEEGMNKVRWMMNRPDDYSCIHQNIAKSQSVTVYSTHWPCVHWWSNIDCLTWFWKTSHDRCLWLLTADCCEEFTVIVVTFRLLSMVKKRTIKTNYFIYKLQ